MIGSKVKVTGVMKVNKEHKPPYVSIKDLEDIQLIDNTERVRYSAQSD